MSLSGQSGTDKDILYRLYAGYLYDTWIPAAFGSLPVASYMVLLVVAYNSASNINLRAGVSIAPEDGSPISWNEVKDGRTDGFVTRVSKGTTAVNGSTGIVLAAVPTNAAWRWIYGEAIFTATAGVGTRSVRLRGRDASGNVYWRSAAQAPTASQSAAVDFAPNLTSEQ